MRPLEYTSSSSNLHYYRERWARADQPYVWVQVLHSAIEKRGGEWVVKRPPTWHLTVYRHGEGELGKFTYRPSTDLGSRLSPRTVARLVNAELGAAV